MTLNLADPKGRLLGKGTGSRGGKYSCRARLSSESSAADGATRVARSERRMLESRGL